MDIVLNVLKAISIVAAIFLHFSLYLRALRMCKSKSTRREKTVERFYILCGMSFAWFLLVVNITLLG